MIADASLGFVKKDTSLATAVTGSVLNLHQEYPNLGAAAHPFYLILQMKNMSGTGSLVFKLQDSADGSTFTDVFTLPFVGDTAPDYVAFPMPVKHRQYLRLVTAVTGTIVGTLQQAILSTSYDLERTSVNESTGPTNIVA